VISNNTFASNSAEDGGAIYCHDSAPTIRKNGFCGNRASSEGGGVYLSSSTGDSLVNNSFYGDSAGSAGGGIYLSASSAQLINNIVWEDTATSFPQICLTGGSSIVVTYCDVRGGWPGSTNISGDPLFVNAPGGDLHLSLGSPCIDTGDPTFPLDPDSTRADMGAFFFDHRPGVESEGENAGPQPAGSRLEKVRPNPIIGSGVFSFSLASRERGHAVLSIYDVTGRLVRRFRGTELGDQSVVWDGRRPEGPQVPSGIYLCRLDVGGTQSSTLRVVVLR
jgi:predicted outer membrane repeat protein